MKSMKERVADAMRLAEEIAKLENEVIALRRKRVCLGCNQAINATRSTFGNTESCSFACHDKVTEQLKKESGV